MDDEPMRVFPVQWDYDVGNLLARHRLEGGIFILEPGAVVHTEIISVSTIPVYRAPLSINLRALVLARDGLICQLCGNPIRYQSNIAIDHIVPVSLGGPDTLDNLRVAHRFCNSRRNNRDWQPHNFGPDVYDKPRKGEQPL